MRAVVFDEVGSVRLDDLAAPVVEEPGDAIVRVTTAAICGSDLHWYHGKAPMIPGEQLGHEGVGIVEEVGEGVSSFRPGQRVVMSFHVICGECWFCRRGQTSLCEEFRNLGAGMAGGSLGGTQAELVRIPNAERNLLAIPGGMDDDRAVFLGDILTTAVYGAAIAAIEEGDTVAVIGAGPVGFLAAQAVRAHAPKEVLVLDMEPGRLELAASIGATAVNVKERNAQMAVADLTEGRGADVVIEAVGAVPAFDSAIEVVRSGGTVCVMGMYVTESVEMQLGMSWFRMLRFVFGGICPVQAWWERARDALEDGSIDPMPLVSHTLPLEEAPKGYELFDRREATKVLLKP